MAQRRIHHPTEANLTGFLLVAHPGLHDPNFHRSIVLVSAHDQDGGALGVVLNRPTGKRLGEVQGELLGTNLAKVPLFHGGPVNPEEMVLVAWEPLSEVGMFKLFFGISAEKAEEMMASEEHLIVRGYLGYSGWSGGQLEGELSENAWFVSPLDVAALENSQDPNIWRRLLVNLKPELSFLVDTPDDPSLN